MKLLLTDGLAHFNKLTVGQEDGQSNNDKDGIMNVQINSQKDWRADGLTGWRANGLINWQTGKLKGLQKDRL